MQKFIFTQTYKVEQDDYSAGGDFPNGKIVTTFQKGQIVEGKYTPAGVFMINVNGQNWPVDRSILVPYGDDQESSVEEMLPCYGTRCDRGWDTPILSQNSLIISVLVGVLVVAFIGYILFKKK